MLDSLRNRLILSHALPMLIILPMMGILLVYVLETRLLLPDLSMTLTGDAVLLAELIQVQPQVLETPGLAGQVLAQASPRLPKRVMFIGPDDRLLASSDPADQERVNQVLALEGLAQAKRGQVVTLTNYNQRLHGEVIDVFAPVVDRQGRLLGTVRATARYATVADELYHLRAWIASVLLFGTLLGTTLGLGLAVTIAGPIQQATRTLSEVAGGRLRGNISVVGPRELQLLTGAVNTLVERLQNLERARRTLLANLVHELGRPVGALRMAAQVIIQGSKDDPGQLDELVRGMDQELGELQRLLEDLTHLYDVDSGMFELEKSELDPAEWLVATLRPWQEMARQKDIQWQQAVPAHLPRLQGDPLRLAQVIGNLVSNAIKMTPAGGSIRVAAGSEPGRLWIRVSDTGPGIHPDELKKIFEPFYRGQAGTQVDSGMGLGLSIAKNLVEAHAGSLEVDSQPGTGSTFTVWLPVGLHKEAEHGGPQQG